jgi:hypothetical protein
MFIDFAFTFIDKVLSVANIKRFYYFTQAFGGKITHLFLHQLNLIKKYKNPPPIIYPR